MIVLKALNEAGDNHLVLLRRRLIHLEDVAVGGQLRGVDGEGNHQPDVMLGDEGRQRIHLLGIERTDDQVALRSGGIL